MRDCCRGDREDQRGSPPLERIEAHAILTQPWLPGAELTETLKLRRAQIEAKYAAEIEALYA